MTESMSIAAQVAFLAIQLGVIIFAARFCGKLAQKLRMPSVLGELVAGIIIGPYLLGSIGFGLHGFEQGLFPLAAGGGGVPVSTPLYAIATLGSIVLLFMSGLETDLRMFFRYSVAGTLVGMGGVIFSFLFGNMLGVWMLDCRMMDPRALFLGILCTATSVGITARILSERKSIDSPEGTTILAAAVIDDVLGIICLAIVMGIVGVATAGTGQIDWGNIEWIAFKSVGIWLGVTAIGLAVAHAVARFLKLFRPSAVYSILAFALALLLAGLFEQAGLAMIVGAYVMGLSLSKTDISFSVQRSLQGVHDFLVPIFFVVMGMLVDVRVLTDPRVLVFGLLYSALAIAAKVIGCALPAFFMNFNAFGALRVGVGMIPRGEVALIIAGIGATVMMNINGKTVPVLDSELFGVAIIMTLMTTLVSPPLLALVLGIKRTGVRKEISDTRSVHTRYSFPSEVLSDFILRMLIDNFRREGFRHSAVDREGGLTHFRRESKTFTLQITGNEFDFESHPADVTIIRTVMYETLVELYRSLGELKQMATPGDLSSAVIGDAPAAVTLPKRQELRIDKIIPPDCIITELAATNQTEAIIELLRALQRASKLVDFDQCVQDVLEREKVVSTCVSQGIAFPHARTRGARELAAAIGISRRGYREFSDSGEEVHIVVLSVCPLQGDKPHLQFVSQVAMLLTKEENIRIFTESGDATAIRACLGKRSILSGAGAASASAVTH